MYAGGLFKQTAYMNPKYLILYIVAGTLALILAAYIAFKTYPAVDYYRVGLNVVMAVFFYYLAYKTYHEKKDKELM